MTTRDKSVREFDVTLPVAPAGIVGSGSVGSYVIGNTGPVGPRGRAGTITIGEVTASETDGDAQVTNIADDDIDVKLNFVLPRGKEGEKGDQGDITEVLIKDADPEPTDAKANIIWLNNQSGDLFKTVLVDDQYEWSKEGNLKGNPGCIIYSDYREPIVEDYYKTGDIYINLSTSELFNFDQDQWVAIASLKGDKGDKGDKDDQGERGSLWFAGQDEPLVTEEYQEQDLYLNTATNQVFVFDNGSWKETTNIQGEIGPKGDTPIIKVGQVTEGKANVTAITDEAANTTTFDFVIPKGNKGDQGDAGFDGTRIIVNTVNPTEKNAEDNVVWLNSETGELFESVLGSNASYRWNKLGNLKGNAGSHIYSGLAAPSVCDRYNVDDLYLNTTSSDLLSYNGKQWIKISNLKGERGERGSLWSSGEENPVFHDTYKSGDFYLNTTTFSVFYFNGTYWETRGSIKGADGLDGKDGKDGAPGPQGPKGDGYTNDGSIDLNAKSIISDDSMIMSDGKGTLQTQHLKSENGWFYTDTTDYGTGSVYYDKMPYASFRGWKMIDDQIWDKRGELSRSYTNVEDKFEVFVHPDGFSDAQGTYNMSLAIDAFVGENHEKRRLAVVGTDRVIGHETVEFMGGGIGKPFDPFYVSSRLVRILPKKLSDIKMMRTNDIDTITNDYMAGSVGLSTNYFTKSQDDETQDGFITPVIWDEDTDDSSQARPLGLPYIPADKKGKLSDKTNIPTGTQSFDLDNQKPCWWNGSSWDKPVLEGKHIDNFVSTNIKTYWINFIDSYNGYINFPNMLNNRTAAEMNGGVKYKYFERTVTDAELETYIYPEIDASSQLTEDQKVEEKSKAKATRTSSGLFPDYSVMQAYNPHATKAINVNNFYFDGTLVTTGALNLGK